jgi:DNA-binding transcriptional LysR family regulator
MATSEWLRTFVAIYRSGSVSGGAAIRGLSQPAASQQLATLERRIGLPLFTRTPHGVEPTRRGRELHAQVADSLDRLEHVLVDLDGGKPAGRTPTLRVGSSPEFFTYLVVPSLGAGIPPISARFGTDPELVDLLEHGELDVAVTSTTPGRRALTSSPIGMKRFILVGSAAMGPVPVHRSLDELGQWMAGRPWVAYSAELPLTRRFWQSVLGQPFAGDLQLVAPDLRAVVAAVEHGLGISLLPEFVCADAIDRQAIIEIHPVADVVAAEPWFACTRVADLDRDPVNDLVAKLSGSSALGGRPPGTEDSAPLRP